MPTRSRGGRHGFEPRARIRSRELRAWELSVAGRTQREIAEALGVTQAAVSKMLARVGAALADELRRKTDVHLARHVARVEAFHRDVTAAWEKSKTEQTRRRHQRVETNAGDAGGAGSKDLIEAVATTREGDPRFSAQVLKALQEQRTAVQFEAGRGGGASPVSEPPPEDPYAEIKRKLGRMTVDELTLLVRVNQLKLLSWSEAARQVFAGLTPEELIALAEIIKKDRDGEYDDPDADPDEAS